MLPLLLPLLHAAVVLFAAVLLLLLLMPRYCCCPQLPCCCCCCPCYPFCCCCRYLRMISDHNFHPRTDRIDAFNDLLDSPHASNEIIHLPELTIEMNFANPSATLSRPSAWNTDLYRRVGKHSPCVAWLYTGGRRRVESEDGNNQRRHRRISKIAEVHGVYNLL